MYKHSKIYVAGHRGLVGSAILKNLKEKGYDNLLTRTHKELDLVDTIAVSDFFMQEKPDYVFLAAAKVGGILANNTYRAEFIYDNVMIQNNVIHQSYLNGVKKLLFLGSTCIYPKDCPQPMKEEHLLSNTLEYTNEPYALAKITGIKMCESYNLQYGTNFISAMPTNLYGPNDNFDLEKSHVLPALLRKVNLGKALEDDNWQIIREDLNNLPIKGVNGNQDKDSILAIFEDLGIKKDSNGVSIGVWGTGTPRREFLWSEDMADACVFLMENRNFADFYPDGEKEIRNTHINIGTGEDISIRDLANLIKEEVGFKGDFFFNTNKPDGTKKKLTDISKLRGLGWEYKIHLKEGVKRLNDWYNSQSGPS
ncbi:GDP-L-fucose synthase family protein [Ulvibacterium marinum]|uniref:GDP-L-fucose synthase n=1 Tax=Ulvibacterium marinum TaxID=2419782 RepID=A0A3B0BXQ1_9FLAO|nr:GDP-L-fucose synthase [Ulvibacterium marinum]RKN76949.1 GDP-L-fucose synthase [Ulvibacterium marinum]